MCKYFHQHASCGCTVNSYTKEVPFYFKSELLRAHTFSFPFLSLKGRKRLAHGVSDTSATHAGLVHEVTDTHCWAQNGSTHGHVFIIFRRRLLINRMRNWEKSCCVNIFLCIPISRTFNKKDEKLSVKILCEYFSFILISRACDASSFWFSRNLFKAPWRQNSQDCLLSKVNPAPGCSWKE